MGAYPYTPVTSEDHSLVRDVLTALVREDDLTTLLESCASAIVEHLDVAFARIWLLDAQHDVLRLRASAGMYTHLDGAHAEVPVGSFKIGRIAATQQPHVSNDVPHDQEVSDPAWAAREGMVAFAGYPLVAGGELVGVVAMFARHELGDDDLRGVAAVADSLALGVKRHLTQDALRLERLATDRLHELGVSLTRELDISRVLQHVTDAAVELSGAEFGAFFYNAVTEVGESYVLYTLSGAPRAAFERFPLPRNTAIFGPTFAGEGVVRLDDVTADPRYGHNRPYRGMPEGHLPVRSYLAVPVIGRSDEVLGGLFFGHPEPGRFTALHERLVTGLASHAAIAVDNAQQYERERTAAVTLQRSLLPAELPSSPAFELCVEYLPASHHVQTGGDWYDALTPRDGTVTFTIGDVGGHDLRAAATMGQVRSALRFAILEGRSPGSALATVDRFLSLESTASFTTAAVVEYDIAARRLTLVSAGHLAPVLCSPDGSCRLVELDQMPALGFGLLEGVDVDRWERRIDVEPGSTLVLYTDGLVEQRTAALDERIRELVEVISNAIDLDVALLCKRIVGEMLGGADQGDDVALLAVRLT